MEYIILGSIFGGVWLLTTIVFIVMYKKKQPTLKDDGQIKQVVETQKEQNILLNNMLMQALKNSEIATQNTINNLTIMFFAHF